MNVVCTKILWPTGKKGLTELGEEGLFAVDDMTLYNSGSLSCPKGGVRDGVALSRQCQNVQFLLVVDDGKADFPPFASGFLVG